MNIEKECIPKEHKELALAARPLVKWIRKNGTPHTTILVTDIFVNVCNTEIGVPIDYQSSNFTEGENKMTVVINAETSTKEQLKEIVKLIAELEEEHTCECTLNLVVR